MVLTCLWYNENIDKEIEMGSNVNRWTEKENDVLYNNYAHSKRKAIMQLLPTRTWGATCVQAVKALGLNRITYERGICSTDWKKREIDIIRAYFPEESDEVLLALLPGRTLNAINARGVILGVPKKHGYQPEDDVFIKKYYPTKGAEWVGNKIGRTAKSVGTRAERIGVRREKYLPLRQVAITQIKQGYIRGDRAKGWVFCLTDEEIGKLIDSPCYYTGLVGTNNFRFAHRLADDNIYSYNGFDRINNDLPHTVENCVPCAGDVNRMRKALGYTEFLELVKLIYEHMELAKGIPNEPVVL